MAKTSGKRGGVVAYYRISYDPQGIQAGVDRQRKEVEELAERNGWVIDQSWTDNDMSATSGKVRPGFEALLASNPSRILVWHQDRLVRQTKDLERVIDLDVPVNTVSSGDLDLATPAGRAVARTIVAWSGYEGEQKAARQRAAHRQRVERDGRPWWGHARPFGYVHNGDLKQDEADALRECYTRIANGATWAECARFLNDQGLLTPKGNRWNSTNLATCMRHPRNAGIVTYHQEKDDDGHMRPAVVEGATASWEPIVPVDEWQRAMNGTRAKNSHIRPGGRVMNLLSGIATCGRDDCDARARCIARRFKRQGETVVVKNYAPTCNHVAAPVEGLDRYVLGALVQRLTSPAAALLLGETEGDQEALRQVGKDLDAANKRLRELDDMFAEGEIDRAERKRMAARIDLQIADLEERERSLAGASPLAKAGGPAAFLRRWRSGELTLGEQRAVLEGEIGTLEIGRRSKGQRWDDERDTTLVWKDGTTPTHRDPEREPVSVDQLLEASTVLQGAEARTRQSWIDGPRRDGL